MIQLAVLPLALALGAATPALDAPAAEQGHVQTVQDEGGQASAAAEEGPGFFEKYYPFTFADNLEPETDENFVVLYISGFATTFALANVWLPMIMLGAPGDFLVEQIIGTIVHYVPVICFPLAPLVVLVNALYLMPVQTVNTFDRNLKLAKKAGTWKAAANTVRPPSEAELALATPSMAF